MPLFCVAGAMQVEAAVGVLGHDHVAGILLLHLGHETGELLQFVVGDAQRGERARLALDRASRLEQFEGTDIGFGRLAVVRQARDHIDAGAHPHLDQAVELERDQRFTDGRTRYRIGLGKHAFRREPLADLESAGGDCRGKIGRDALVQSSGFNLGHGPAINGQTNFGKSGWCEVKTAAIWRRVEVWPNWP